MTALTDFNFGGNPEILSTIFVVSGANFFFLVFAALAVDGFHVVARGPVHALRWDQPLLSR